MASKRPVILMGVLLLLLGAYIARPFVEGWVFAVSARPAVAAPTGPLPSANGLSNLAVARSPQGRWIASVDYAYTGEPKHTMVRIVQVITGGGTGGAMDITVRGVMATPGTHRISVELPNPDVRSMYTTEKVAALMEAMPSTLIARASVDQRIQWPDPLQVEVEQALAAGKPDAIVHKAVALIDNGSAVELRSARSLLQALVDKSPGVDAAYVELARVAMKTNWNASGLRDAESLLGSALQVRPDSVNAKILLGYVYAHQRRHKESEALFAQAAAADPPNLWLWSNWGELLAMRGKDDAAIQKYRQAIARPPTGNTYDRARWDAYWHLLPLLERRQDLAGIEAVLKQRAQEYPGADCFGVAYARFLVVQRGEAAAAQALLRDAPSPNCVGGEKRLVEGLTRYVAWSQGKDPERADSLRQARAFHPVNPALFHALAASDSGAAVVRQLLATGEKLAMQDEQQLDALTYALRDGETAVARRLLRLGANPLAEVGPQKMPAALIPVMNRDFDGIRLLQRAGVDYTKLRFQGTTALDHARTEGDSKLQQVLDPKSGGA